jgi:hypothetical protein
VRYHAAVVRTLVRVKTTWRLLLVALYLLHADRADAKFLYETPADIARIRGMPVALTVCVIALLLVRHRLTADAAPSIFTVSRSSRLHRWAVVGAFVVFLFATIPIGFPIASAIVVRIGHDAFRNSINAAAAFLGAGFLWLVFRQPHLRRLPVVLSLAAIGAAYLYFFSVLEVPVKRIHFMEYSLLSVLVYRALRPDAPPRIYLWCAVAAMLVGSSEEALSLLSARRFGAVSDVLWDTTGGLLGTLVLKYVLVERPAVSQEWAISGVVTR